MIRTYWQIPDPENKLSTARRRVKAYAAANGMSIAEAIMKIVELANI